MFFTECLEFPHKKLVLASEFTIEWRLRTISVVVSVVIFLWIDKATSEWEHFQALTLLCVGMTCVIY